MGSSAKKKKEKKKDFQKVKLKVGKTKPKASNFTDTSFSSKAIVLNQQSLSTAAPSSNSQFAHHLSLLTHKSDTQRRDSLAYLTTAISSRPVSSPLPLPLGIILPKLQPLILDGSNSVRQQLIKLLRSLPREQVEDHVEQLLLYVRAGMTHLAADIRNASLDILGWLLDTSGYEVVSCAGGWVKTLKCFLAMLGWQVDSGATKWSSKASFGKAGSEGKAQVKQFQTLEAFLQIGLVGRASIDTADYSDGCATSFPLWHTQQHLVPQRSNCFAHLNLFGAPRDEESEIYEDKEDRLRLFVTFRPAIEQGVENARKEGGEVGRAAAGLRKVLIESLRDYSDDQ
ncbi:MAG: rRNA processing protein [Sarea resinae]|nr:MAG: rRNA processing protein [Sarea resinae]